MILGESTVLFSCTYYSTSFNLNISVVLSWKMKIWLPHPSPPLFSDGREKKRRGKREAKFSSSSCGQPKCFS